MTRQPPAFIAVVQQTCVTAAWAKPTHGGNADTGLLLRLCAWLWTVLLHRWRQVACKVPGLVERKEGRICPVVFTALFLHAADAAAGLVV